MKSKTERSNTSSLREQQALDATIFNASILMIDDDPVLTKILKAQLSAENYKHFFHESDPHNALQSIERVNPDLVLLDLVMPDVDGFELLTKIRKNPKTRHLPVIMLTSSTDAKIKLEALERGATDFIPKPVDKSELLLRIRNILTVKAYQDQLTYYDNLTGLPNRILFMDRLDWALKNAKRNQSAVAVLDIGLDHFRKINESLGPQIGDQLLKQLSDRLVDCVRQNDVVSHVGGEELWRNLARLGGDEFSILLTAMASPESAGYVALRLQQAVSDPFFVDDHELFLTVSIGISIYPEDGDNADQILQHAASATEYVKQHGRSNFQFFSQDLHQQSRALLSLEMDLHKALERSEFSLHYQPQVNPKVNKVVGFEALLRWNHPIHGTVSPADFVPLIEKMGLIDIVGEWILEEACSQAITWMKQGLGSLNVSVNLSARQFVLDNLAHSVRRVLDESGLPPQLLTLELTESMLVQGMETNIQIMEQLREIGVELSIDDFGTGYSSLSYLRHFPVQELKVDRAFIMDIEKDEVARAIVSSIVTLARNLNLKVVIEGVEESPQVRFTKVLGCKAIQGFYYSRPLEPDAFEAFVRTFNRIY